MIISLNYNEELCLFPILIHFYVTLIFDNCNNKDYKISPHKRSNNYLIL